ncbi:MAG: hypothetical protein ACFFAJ_10545 [Candidatus Hodarchaeota archaeon]
MTDRRNNSRIGKLIDGLSAYRMHITSLYLLILGLISFFCGGTLVVTGGRIWSSTLMFLGFPIIFIALITMIGGILVWVSKSQAKGIPRFTLGYISLMIFVFLRIYQMVDDTLRDYIIERAIISSVQLSGVILLGTWSFALFSLLGIFLLVGYRSTKIS